MRKQWKDGRRERGSVAVSHGVIEGVSFPLFGGQLLPRTPKTANLTG